MEADRPALAVDIGGTKLAAGLVGPGGRLLSWEQTPTRRDLDVLGRDVGDGAAWWLDHGGDLRVRW